MSRLVNISKKVVIQKVNKTLTSLFFLPRFDSQLEKNSKSDLGHLSFGPTLDLHLHHDRLATDLQFAGLIRIKAMPKEPAQDICQT